MSLIVSMVAAFAAGFLGHQVRPILRRDFQGGWFPISCYVVGILTALPFVVFMDRSLERSSRASRLAAAYLLAFLGVGSGVVAGYYLSGRE